MEFNKVFHAISLSLMEFNEVSSSLMEFNAIQTCFFGGDINMGFMGYKTNIMDYGG
jgi:hypothetical protein